MAKIYMQRHAQPDISSKICYGVSDVALHADFEAKHLAEVLERIKEVRVERIYSSPLQRCRRLAAEIRESMGVEGEVIIDPRLMELNFGDWELLSWDDIYNTSEGRVWFEDYINCRTPNGESFADMLERAGLFIGELQGIEHDVMVVTHSGFIRAMMVCAGMVTRDRVFDLRVEYGELIELEF